MEIPGPFRSYKIPANTAPFAISISFHDSIDRALTYWLTNWINTIVNPGDGYVRTIGDPLTCKTVQILWLDSMRRTVRTATYLVFPDGGPLVHRGGSNPGPETLNYTFAVAKVIEAIPYLGSETYTRNPTLSETLGGFASAVLGGGVLGQIGGNIVRNVANDVSNNAINRMNNIQQGVASKYIETPVANAVRSTTKSMNQSVNSQFKRIAQGLGL